MKKIFEIAKFVYEFAFRLIFVFCSIYLLVSITYHVFLNSQFLLEVLSILKHAILVTGGIFIVLAIVSKISNKY